MTRCLRRPLLNHETEVINRSSGKLQTLDLLISFQGRKRRRVRWSNTRTRRKKKGSEEDEDSQEESSNEEESEEEDDSDEDYKVERSRKRRNRNRERRSSDSSTSSDDDLPPNDDPCKHCGLPNHPELVGPDVPRFLLFIHTENASVRNRHDVT